MKLSPIISVRVIRGWYALACIHASVWWSHVDIVNGKTLRFDLTPNKLDHCNVAAHFNLSRWCDWTVLWNLWCLFCEKCRITWLCLFSWVLYEKPGFQGRIIALEEGPTDGIVNVWAEEETPATLDEIGEPIPTAPVVIGSIRLAVRVSWVSFNLIQKAQFSRLIVNEEMNCQSSHTVLFLCVS